VGKFSDIKKTIDDGAGEGATRKIDVSDFAPVSGSIGRDPSRDDEIADRIARKHGLPGEPVSRVKLVRGSVVMDKVFVQGPITTINRFKELCNDRGGITYAEALKLLLDRYDETNR